LVCLPRQPRCDVCPIAKHCVAYREDCVQELPGVRQRVRATPRRFAAFVAQQGKHFLVRQRPAGIVNAYLWEFPNVELEPEDSHRRRLVQKPNAGGRASSRALISKRLWAREDARPPDHAVLKRSLRRAARRALGLMPKTLEPLCVIKHPSLATALRWRCFGSPAISDRGCTGQGPMGAPEGTEPTGVRQRPQTDSEAPGG